MRTKNIVGFLLLGLILVSAAACKPAEFFPKDGVWYCVELEMQLDFSKHSDSFIKVDSEKILCGYSINRGSDILSVYCQEHNCKFYYIGEEILAMRFVSLDDTTLIMKAFESDVTYTFMRTS